MCIWGFYRLSSLVTPHRMTISCRTNEFHIRSFSGPSGCLFGSSLILDLCVGSCSKHHRFCCGFQRTTAPCLTPNSYFMSNLKQADSLRVVFREKQEGASHILFRSPSAVCLWHCTRLFPLRPSLTTPQLLFWCGISCQVTHFIDYFILLILCFVGVSQ